MTQEEIKQRVKNLIYVTYNAGNIMRACDRRGFKYRINSNGLFAKGERMRCEERLIKAMTEEQIKRQNEGA